LAEGVTRIRTIAFVHETLSQASSDLVDFGDVMRGVIGMLQDALGLVDRGIKIRFDGEIGELPAGVATPLSLVLTELVQNAAEHAFPLNSCGTSHVEMYREDGFLRAEVVVDGEGLPDDFSWEGAGLSLQIVRRLITEELNGTIELHGDGGTHVDIDIALPEYPGR